MEYGVLQHHDLAFISKNPFASEVVLAKYNDYDNGYFGEGDYYCRTDYFSFFGTDITYRADDVIIRGKVISIETE